MILATTREVLNSEFINDVTWCVYMKYAQNLVACTGAV